MTCPPTRLPEIPRRRRARVVRIGNLAVGGDHPILIQSMTVADTMDTSEVVREIRELVEAGCPLVRVTTPSVVHARNLREIRARLAAEGIRVPMVADVHFTPNAALVAAEIVEKVRINPGNYADRKRFEPRCYTDDEYAAELERVAERFRPLVRRLKENGAALRIGTNHGSLSDRIMNRFGDTPEGMVESALEFVRICDAEGYHEIVLSMKSSIPGVMIAAYRLLVRRMDELGMDYPLHLGVTEAGDGLEARVKSAAGIGSLLADGIGDTIRVSLAEDSRHEIAAAQAILDSLRVERAEPDGFPAARVITPADIATEPAAFIATEPAAAVAPATATRRSTRPIMFGGIGVGGTFPVRVEARVHGGIAIPAEAEIVALGPVSLDEESSRLLQWLDAVGSNIESFTPRPAILLETDLFRPGQIHVLEAALPLVDGVSLAFHEDDDGERLRLFARLLARARKPVRWRVDRGGSGIRGLLEACREEGLWNVGFLCEPGPRWIARVRELARSLEEEPLFLEVPAYGAAPALLAGSVLHDGLGDALRLAPEDSGGSGVPWPAGGRTWEEDPVRSAYAILQACRLRLTRAELIACPSCGRTQFDLQAATARIRSRTEHLKGVKIAIMGCVVNGPGEMADADFGYVGSGPKKVDLYCGRERVRQGVPESEALERLLELIRERGLWSDPPISG